MKIISKIDVILLAVFCPALLFLGLFYFYPIPQNLKPISNSISLKRCIYNGGIGYSSRLLMESLLPTNISSMVFYNSAGEVMCATGGFTNKKPEGSCKYKICFPIFNYNKTTNYIDKHLWKIK